MESDWNYGMDQPYSFWIGILKLAEKKKKKLKRFKTKQAKTRNIKNSISFANSLYAEKELKEQ